MKRWMMAGVMYIALCRGALGLDVNVSGNLLAPACAAELPADSLVTLPEVSLAQLYKGESKPTSATIKIRCYKLTAVSFTLRTDQTDPTGVVKTDLSGIGLEMGYGLSQAGVLTGLVKPGETINHALLNEALFIIKARPVIIDESRAAAGSYSASALLSIEYR
ncbi:fimbrial protein [Pantoea sp. KXB25]|uniref:fimbrial protein n=1 Tax=unclassified Pantoea TaxID=2630326 RepID=UPI0025D873C1|nr:fimbrial protein [uncultured Pantoea sp.]